MGGDLPGPPAAPGGVKASERRKVVPPVAGSVKSLTAALLVFPGIEPLLMFLSLPGVIPGVRCHCGPKGGRIASVAECTVGLRAIPLLNHECDKLIAEFVGQLFARGICCLCSADLLCTHSVLWAR